MIHLAIQVPHWGPTTPVMQAQPVWAGPFSLAATGESILFLFLRLLRCFNSAGIAFMPYVSDINDSRFRLTGFPIRKSPGQSVFAATRGLSR